MIGQAGRYEFQAKKGKNEKRAKKGICPLITCPPDSGAEKLSMWVPTAINEVLQAIDMYAADNKKTYLRDDDARREQDKVTDATCSYRSSSSSSTRFGR